MPTKDPGSPLHHLHLLIIAGLVLALSTSTVRAGNLNLPELGDRSSSIISPEQEQEIGDAWLRLYRSRVPEYTDPELTAYLQSLLAHILPYSEVTNNELQLIVIDNPQINAFAAPGGIIGANSGLFLTAQSEAELAGVFSHELAHLSQHHWVRGMEASRENLLPVMAGLLTGLVLMATNNGMAGMAAISSTQAASAQSSLSFSRQNEQEADDIGIKTLAAAGYDPTAMTTMFERMLDNTRYLGQRPPDYLQSHPVTEKRIAETRARTVDLPQKHYDDALAFHLMRARVRLHYEETPQIAIKRFQSELEGKTLNVIASRYGLALAQTRAHQFDEAEKNLHFLMEENTRENLGQERTFTLALADLEFERSQPAKAASLIETFLEKSPTDYPARMQLSRMYFQEKKFNEAEQVLYRLSQERPNDVQVWYELAEVRGLAGNIAGLHIARGEYYILNGVYDKARMQLNYALKLLDGKFVETERIKERLRSIEKLEKISLKI